MRSRFHSRFDALICFVLTTSFNLRLSGSCSKDNCGEISVSVPYGTNTNGQTVCYKTEKNSLFSASAFGPVPGFDSCGPQLTQVTFP